MQTGQVVASFGGGVIATVLPPPEELPATVRSTGGRSEQITFICMLTFLVFAISIFSGDNAHVGKAVWEDFLPKALASGQLVPAPAAEVVGKGLDSVADACKKQKAGVSGKKIVVTL